MIANEGSLLILVQYDFRYHVFMKWFRTSTRGEYFPLSSLELILMYAFVKQRTDGRCAKKVNQPLELDAELLKLREEKNSRLNTRHRASSITVSESFPGAVSVALCCRLPRAPLSWAPGLDSHLHGTS